MSSALFDQAAAEEGDAMRAGWMALIEVFRHTGFFPQAEIEKQLAEMGVTR